MIRHALDVIMYYHLSQKEKMKYQKDYMESVKRPEEQWAAKQEKHGPRKVKVGPSDNGIDKKSNQEV